MPRSETPLRSDLFPEISPYASGMLAVDGRHTIYWEQCGNPDGAPVVFLHGGPGAGSAPVHRRFFDPAALPHRAVRPARLRPLACRSASCATTPPAISSPTSSGCASHLGIEQWLVFGGSWGSDPGAGLRRDASRARAPASSCAASSCARAARSTGSSTACAAIFPEAWRDFAEHLPDAERGDLLAALLSPPDRSRSRRAIGRRRAPGAATRRACSTLYPTARAPFESDHGGFALGAVAHRGPLLRQRHFVPEGWPWLGSRPHPPSALHHRAGPLRHRLPAGDRRRAGARLAGGALRHRAGRRPQRARARHPRRTGQRHRKLPRCRCSDVDLFAPRFPWETRGTMSFELPPEQTGAAAWYGPEIAKRDDWLMPLSAAEIAEVESAATALAARDADIAAITRAGLSAADARAQAQGARARRSAERPRLPAAARPAGRALVDARSGDGILRPGRPSRQRALAERQGPCAGPRAGSRARRARSQRAHLPDQRAADLSTPIPATSSGCCASRRRSPAACRRW